MLSNIIYFSCLFIQDSIWLDVCACVRAGAHSLKRSIYVWVWSKKQQKQPGLLVECTNTEYSSILCTLNQMYCVYCTESCVYELHIHKHVRRSVCACMLQREKHGIPIVFEGFERVKNIRASFFFSPPILLRVYVSVLLFWVLSEFIVHKFAGLVWFSWVCFGNINDALHSCYNIVSLANDNKISSYILCDVLCDFQRKLFIS